MITERKIRSTIAGVATGERGKEELKDGGERGGGRLSLLVRRTSSGASAEWYAVWHRDGARRSTKMGTYPTLSLAHAREAYRTSFLPEILAGKDPHGPRTFTRIEGRSITDLANAYVQSLRAKGKVSADRAHHILLSPNGLVNSIGSGRLAADVTPDDIIPHLKAIHARGSIVLAANVRGWARAMFEFAIKSRHSYSDPSSGTNWGVRINPVVSIPSDPEAKRARLRYLSPSEFRSFWRWLKGKEHLVRYGNAKALRLIMVTGQRPSEILRIGSGNYDQIEESLAWTTTKNGMPHAIPLPRQAVEILTSIRPNAHGLFFPRREFQEQPVHTDALRAVLNRYFIETGATPFETRDLRRTWKTLTGAAELSKEIRDRLQNHALRDVASVHYDRYSYWREKWEAMKRWEVFLDTILAEDGGDAALAVVRRTAPMPPGRTTLLIPGVLPPTPHSQSGL